MLKPTNGVTSANIRKIAFAVVSERSMSNIVPQGNGLNEVFIQAEEAAYIPGNFGKKLNMQNPMSNVVVVNKIKNLGFVNVAGIGQ